MRRAVAALAVVLVGAVSVAGASGQRAGAPAGAPPDAELLLQLDLLREGDLAKQRDLYSKLSLFERLKLLEQLGLLDLESELTPARKGGTKR